MLPGVANALLVHRGGLILNATGGAISNHNGFRVHDFSANGSFVISQISEPVAIEWIICGGGGGGGRSGSGQPGGGGDGGQVKIGTMTISAPGSFAITRGQGGEGGEVDGNSAGAGGSSSIAGFTGATAAGGAQGLNGAPSGVAGGGVIHNWLGVAQMFGDGGADGSLSDKGASGIGYGAGGGGADVPGNGLPGVNGRIWIRYPTPTG